MTITDRFARVSGARLFFFLALALCAPPASAAPIDDGQAAYEREDYPAALRIFRDLAAKGDPLAEAWMGHLYENGRGLPRSAEQAADWYRKAAQKGNAFAQWTLGAMHADGRGVPKDDALALALFRKAADQNDANAQNWI